MPTTRLAHVFPPSVLLCLALLCAAVAASCASRDPEAPRVDTTGADASIAPTDARAPVRCRAVVADEHVPLRRATATPVTTVTFEDLRVGLKAACGACHLYGARGNFTFTDDRASYQAAAPRMAEVILSGLMPKVNPDPAGAIELGRRLRAWVDAAYPDVLVIPAQGAADASKMVLPADRAERMSDLGDCIPEARSQSGGDAAKDAFFASATRLPESIDATDLVSFDAAELAAHGTYAYAPTYQLWADDARKLRLVHVPAGQSIALDPTTQKFVIPPNTRFYKTFFKRVVEADGHVGYRKIETRLIVSRAPQETSLFGTYVWDASETRATLLEDPYRSGESFADRVASYETDESTHATRQYALPARHRCVQCHQGSEGQNFVLGFTPLQINRRRAGEGGLLPDAHVGDDALTQVERLVAFGVVTGVRDASDLPSLESSAVDENGETRAARNVHELRAQAYMVGNCAHCHNPKGFPVLDNKALDRFDLSPGGVVFQFPLASPKLYALSHDAYYVKPGDPASSPIYRRMIQDDAHVATPEAKSASLEKDGVVYQHMPLNVPGKDCKGVGIIGRWISSIEVIPPNATPEAMAAAREKAERAVRDFDARFDAECKPSADVVWFKEDLSEPEPWRPRRADWATDAEFNARWRDFDVTRPELVALANTKIATGWWANKIACKFPVLSALDEADRAPWTLDVLGRPLSPPGRLYKETPGAHIFRVVCRNCHGSRADANSGIAKGLNALTQGNIRVANLADGLFGPRAEAGKHMRGEFEQTLGAEGAAKYVIFMASGGTKVQFPPEFTGSFVTASGDGEPVGAQDVRDARGNMLDVVGIVCKKLLPTPTNPKPQLDSKSSVYELYRRVCTLGNPIPASTSDAAAVTAWLSRAQANAGAMVYYFLKNDGLAGRWPVPRTQCEDVYPAP